MQIKKKHPAQLWNKKIIMCKKKPVIKIDTSPAGPAQYVTTAPTYLIKKNTPSPTNFYESLQYQDKKKIKHKI